MKDDLTYPMLSNQGNKPFSEFFRQKFLNRTKQHTRYNLIREIHENSLKFCYPQPLTLESILDGREHISMRCSSTLSFDMNTL